MSKMRRRPATVPALERRIKALRQELELSLVALEAARKQVEERAAASRRRSETVSKIDFVFDVIKRRKRGVTIFEIKEVSASAGQFGGKGFPYLQLYQLRREGSIKKSGDKFVVEKG